MRQRGAGGFDSIHWLRGYLASNAVQGRSLQCFTFHSQVGKVNRITPKILCFLSRLFSVYLEKLSNYGPYVSLCFPFFCLFWICQQLQQQLLVVVPLPLPLFSWAPIEIFQIFFPSGNHPLPPEQVKGVAILQWTPNAFWVVHPLFSSFSTKKARFIIGLRHRQPDINVFFYSFEQPRWVLGTWPL